MKRPCATWRAARSSRPTRRAEARRDEESAEQREQERAARRDQHAVAHERDGLLHVLEVARVERDPRRGCRGSLIRWATIPISSPPKVP